jgi:hypothetical protein
MAKTPPKPKRPAFGKPLVTRAITARGQRTRVNLNRGNIDVVQQEGVNVRVKRIPARRKMLYI